MMSLKNKLLSAMAGSTSQSPVDISKLYLLGPRKQVESALLELHKCMRSAAARSSGKSRKASSGGWSAEPTPCHIASADKLFNPIKEKP